MKRFIIPLFLLMPFCLLWSAVNIEVGTGLVVETTSGGYTEIDGDLTETGTGYYSGIISSGARTGVTTFAGMTLSSGMDGTIVRNTGAAYAKGNGEGTNMKRYYELNNTGAVRYPAGTGRLREVIAAAAYLSKWRGTAQGLLRFLETATGIDGFRIEEQVLDANGEHRPFHIRVRSPASAQAYRPLIERIVEMEKPAYVTYELQFDD